MSTARDRRAEALRELARGDEKLSRAMGTATFNPSDRVAVATAHFGRSQACALLAIAEDVAALRRALEGRTDNRTTPGDTA